MGKEVPSLFLLTIFSTILLLGSCDFITWYGKSAKLTAVVPSPQPKISTSFLTTPPRRSVFIQRLSSHRCMDRCEDRCVKILTNPNAHREHHKPDILYLCCTMNCTRMSFRQILLQCVQGPPLAACLRKVHSPHNYEAANDLLELQQV